MSRFAVSSALAFRPPRSYRALYVVVVLVGLFVGLSGLAAGSDVVGGVLIGVVGLMFAGVGVAGFRSKVWVADDALFTRFIRVRRVEAAMIMSISVEVHGSGGNLYPAVDRRQGRRMWLTAMGRFDTKRSQALLDDQVRAIAKALSV